MLEIKGAEWRFGPVSHEPDEDAATKVTIRDKVPYLFINDTRVFDEAYPGVVGGSLNGTSIKVISQNTARRILQKNGKTNDETLMQAIWNAIQGVRSRGALVRETVFTNSRGQTFPSLEALQAAEMAFLIDLGVDPEVARTNVLSA